MGCVERRSGSGRSSVTEKRPAPATPSCRRLPARGRACEDLLGLEDFDRGEDLVVRDGPVVDGELQLVAGSDERPISEIGHVG